MLDAPLTEQQKLAAQEGFAAATRAGDVAAMAAMSEPEAVVWHNYDNAVVSADESNRRLRWLHRTVPDVAWEDVAVRPTSDGFVWQAVLTGTAPKGPLLVHTCIVVTLAGTGKVRRTDEYLDAAALLPLND